MTEIKISMVIYFIAIIMTIALITGLIPEDKQKDCGYGIAIIFIFGKLQEITETLGCM